MLDSAQISAIVPVSDIDRAADFYGEALGLNMVARRADMPENPEAEFSAGEGALVAYKSVAAGQSRGTIAGFRVDDIDAAVASLRERGVTFEEYDMADLKTENGIATLGDVRVAWFKDPDGNILAVEQTGG